MVSAVCNGNVDVQIVTDIFVLLHRLGEDAHSRHLSEVGEAVPTSHRGAGGSQGNGYKGALSLVFLSVYLCFRRFRLYCTVYLSTSKLVHQPLRRIFCFTNIFLNNCVLPYLLT
jgi:hypothetical protein